MQKLAQEAWVEIIRLNPWWISDANRPKTEHFHKRKVLKRTLNILHDKEIRRFPILSGLRRVGKTTVLRQCIAELLNEGINPNNILFLTYDAIMLREYDLQDIYLEYKERISPKGETFLFVDEIQYLRFWSVEVKTLYDRYSEVRMAAAGSASTLLEKGYVESGIGRFILIKVPTLSFGEYCNFRGLPKPEWEIDGTLETITTINEVQKLRLSEAFRHLEEPFRDYLLVGGFPEIAPIRDPSKALSIIRTQILEGFFSRDLPLLFSARDPSSIRRIFRYIAEIGICLLNVNAISKNVPNLSHNTVDNYIAYLSEANLIYLCEPIKAGGKAILTERRKAYISDPGLRNASLSLIKTRELLPTELGILAELTTYKHVLEELCSNDPGLSAGYYRQSKPPQREIDIIVESYPCKTLIEVKYQDSPELNKSDGIIYLANEEDRDIKKAFLITKRNDDIGRDSVETKIPIAHIPAHIFAYLLSEGDTSIF